MIPSLQKIAALALGLGIAIAGCSNGSSEVAVPEVLGFDSLFSLQGRLVLVDTPHAPVVLPSSVLKWGDRVAVLDQVARDIKVFDHEGRLDFVLGGQGGGPGEFSSPVALARARADSIAVLDAAASRITIFTGLGAIGREIALPPGRYHALVALDGGRFAVGGRPLSREAHPETLLPRILLVGPDGVVQQLGRMPPPLNPGEPNLEMVTLTRLGTHLIAYRLTTNRGVHVDLKSGRERPVRAASSLYRPLTWFEGDQRPKNLGELADWWNEQMKVLGPVAVSERHYLVQVVDPTAPETTCHYAIVTLKSRTIAVASKPCAEDAPIMQDFAAGQLIAIDQADEGALELTMYSIRNQLIR